MEKKDKFSKDKIKIIVAVIVGIIIGVLVCLMIFASEKDSGTNGGAVSVAEKIEGETMEAEESESAEASEATSAMVATTKYKNDKKPEPQKNDKKEPDYKQETTKETVNITERFDSYEMIERNFELKTTSGILYATNKVVYPRFYGNSPAERLINEKYEKLISDYSKRTPGDVDEWYNTAMNKNLLPTYQNTTVTVTFASDEYISILEVTTDYNGVRPFDYEEGYTYRLDSTKELSYKDFFKGDASFIDRTMDEAFLAVMNKSEAPENWYDECEFVITDEGITFYYNVGRSVAREKISVPYSKMEDTEVNNKPHGDNSNLKELLVNNEWYNAIQTEHTYHFYGDGTALENTKSFNYTLQGDTLTIYWESGYVSTLKYVTKGDNYNWQEDGYFYSIYQAMPEGEKFFYETDYVNTDAPDNAMWIRMK